LAVAGDNLLELHSQRKQPPTVSANLVLQHRSYKMKNIILITALLLLESIALAQANYGIRFNLGCSKISLENERFELNSETHFAPSGQVGIFYLIPIKGISTIGLEMVISQIDGKEISHPLFTGPNKTYSSYSNIETYTHITYLCLPIYYEINLNSLSLNAGMQVAYCLLSKEKVKGTVIIEGDEDSWEKTTSNIGIDRFDAGFRLGLAYKISSKISIEGEYYYGINNINSSNSSYKSKIQQISTGIRYNFK